MTRRWQRWTPREDAQLTLTYHRMRRSLLARHFNRSENAIYQRAFALGIAKTRTPTPEPVESTDVIDRQLARMDRLKRRTRCAA